MIRLATRLWQKSLMLGLSLGVLSISALATEQQMSFTNPQDAVNAMIAGCKYNDTKTLLELFGPEGKDIVESGDTDQDKDSRRAFAKLAQQENTLVADPANPDKMILSIGKEDWPFPIPLVRRNGRWYFNSVAGRQEILARRIGANELTAIEVCHGYVEAQFEYAQTHSSKGVPVYAQKIVSTPGKQDGLYWENAPGLPVCDVPQGFARAATGMDVTKRDPYRGFYYKVLKSQGGNAHGGAMNYVVNNMMIGGFALLAWPAEYGVSGIQSFIVDHDGMVYESNLGRETDKLAQAMTDFNPDSAWHPIESEPLK